MTAEVIEQSQTPTSAAELLQLPMHEIGSTGNPEVELPINESLPLESKVVLKRYIENGLSINVKAPSRVERIARGIVQEISSLTPEKIAKLAKATAVSYIKNVNPANLVRENWYWRGGVGLGLGVGVILTATGARFVPVVGPWARTAISLGMSGTFAYLAEKDYQMAVRKIERLNLDEAEKSAKLAELDGIKAKATSIKKGMSAGFAYLGFLNAAETIGGEFLSPTVTFAAELGSTPATDPVVTHPLEVADEYTQLPPAKPGYEMVVKAFGQANTVDANTGTHEASLVGWAKAVVAQDDYHIGKINPQTGEFEFDPHDVDQLQQLQAESQADSRFNEKVTAVVNKVISDNQDKIEAFEDDQGHLTGDSFTFAYDDGTPIGFNTLKSWTNYLDDGAYQADVNGPAHVQIMNEGYQFKAETFSGDDPYFKNLTPDELGLQDTDLQPGEVSSIHGLAQAWYARDYLGIKDFDPINNDDHLQRFLDATTPTSEHYDPLSEARINAIAHEFVNDPKNQGMVILDQQGNPTDLFRRVNDHLDATGQHDQPITLRELKDYYDLAATLVNEGPVAANNFGPDGQLWTHYHFDHDLDLENAANKILAREDLQFFDFDPNNPDHWEKLKELIQAKYGDNPELVSHKLEAIKSLLKVNPKKYFAGDNLVTKSALTGQSNDFKIVRNLSSILDTVK